MVRPAGADNDVPVHSYRITETRSGRFSVVAGDATSATWDGLPAGGGAATFSVAALNAAVKRWCRLNTSG